MEISSCDSDSNGYYIMLSLLLHYIILSLMGLVTSMTLVSWRHAYDAHLPPVLRHVSSFVSRYIFASKLGGAKTVSTPTMTATTTTTTTTVVTSPSSTYTATSPTTQSSCTVSTASAGPRQSQPTKDVLAANRFTDDEITLPPPPVLPPPSYEAIYPSNGLLYPRLDAIEQ